MISIPDPKRKLNPPSNEFVNEKIRGQLLGYWYAISNFNANPGAD
jgi:hypothetical protein